MADRAYYTQKEVAEIFRVSQATVIKWRLLGYLEYFRPPGSSRVLYPVEAVEHFKKEYAFREEVRERPRINGSHSRRSAPQQEWRI
jgi:hypothetical protein